ncbi:hypothetical protein CHS0354_041761 [Potamilus streckersoni]|uniref:Uncharacterized protein n=1 Tax=Potamilus streckersoni TaxID=2493646 RepID=A0AAE0T235_9BIVA|nr:hypothetical protein CHS0354_041761 [Potamilus streckersoni]
MIMQTEYIFTIAHDLRIRCESQSDLTNTTADKLQGGNVNAKRLAHTNQKMIHQDGSHSGQDIYQMHIHINKETYTTRDEKNERSATMAIDKKYQHYQELWSESEDESLVYSDSEYEPSDDEQYVFDSQSTDSCDSDITPNHLKVDSLKLEDYPKQKISKKRRSLKRHP